MSHTRYTSIGELITDTTIIRHFVCLRPRHTSDLLFDKPCINSFNYLLYLLITCSQPTGDVRHVAGGRLTSLLARPAVTYSVARHRCLGKLYCSVTEAEGCKKFA